MCRHVLFLGASWVSGLLVTNFLGLLFGVLVFLGVSQLIRADAQGDDTALSCHLLQYIFDICTKSSPSSLNFCSSPLTPRRRYFTWPRFLFLSFPTYGIFCNTKTAVLVHIRRIVFLVSVSRFQGIVGRVVRLSLWAKTHIVLCFIFPFFLFSQRKRTSCSDVSRRAVVGFVSLVCRMSFCLSSLGFFGSFFSSLLLSFSVSLFPSPCPLS